MKTLYLMIGVAGSGKDTWINNYFNPPNFLYILSSDNIIEAVADDLGLTYTEFWKYGVDAAQKMVNSVANFLNENVTGECSVIWNQTNLTEKSRNAKLQLFPNWRKIAVHIHTPLRSELDRRLEERAKAEHKVIPVDVIDNMIRNLQAPVFAEGYDEIWNIIGPRMTIDKKEN